MNGEVTQRRVLCDIARSAFDVVNRLLSRDQLLARPLRTSVTRSRQIYREECITVEVAAKLREQFSNHVEIVLFTPPEETRTGADWYWRFERAGGAIHARVQAKRVQRTEFNQNDTLGHIDLDRPQLTQLLDATSQASNEIPELQAWLATYVRFDATPPCGQNALESCIRHSHPECRWRMPSVWIANASDFESSAPRVPVRSVIENSLRLDCLLPCIDRSEDGEGSGTGAGPGADPGPAAKGFALRTDLRTYEDCIAAIENSDVLRSGIEGALRIWI